LFLFLRRHPTPPSLDPLVTCARSFTENSQALSRLRFVLLHTGDVFLDRGDLPNDGKVRIKPTALVRVFTGTLDVSRW
jgi:hypothetical protein